MQTKAKKFSKKLLALFMAVLMALTAFSGAFSAFAASNSVQYYDDAVEYNDLAWPVLSDEQTATALLDYLDTLLRENGADLEKAIGKAVGGLGVSVLKWDSTNRTIKISAVIANATIQMHLQSVDQILSETLPSIHDAVNNDLKSYIGDAKNLQLDSTRGMTRANSTSCEILQALVGILQKNSSDYFGKDTLGQFLRGNFGLGTVGNLAKINIYDILRGLFNADSGYQSNLVYNIVKSILFNNTNWFTPEEKAAYKAGTATFEFDSVLIDKLNTKFLREINSEITYKVTTGSNQTESSKDRYKAIKAYMTDHADTTFKAAALALGYDPEVVYTKDGNVCLFQYGTNENGTPNGSKVITFSKSDSLFTFGWQALDLAWSTALKDTLATLRVNYSVERGHGSNFDNSYYYWAKAEYKDWNPDAAGFNIADMYTPERINAWANHIANETVTSFNYDGNDVWVVGSYSETTVEYGLTTDSRYGETVYVINDPDIKDIHSKQAVTVLPSDIAIKTETKENDDGTTTTIYSTDTRRLYEIYGAADADEFLGWVKNNYEFDRGLVDGSTGAWSDIDPKTLFTKLRYSPLADYGFNMTTGPINLYFMLTGTPNLNSFFDTYKANYGTLVGGINDALVAAVKDIFINRSVRSNVYGGENASAYPTLSNVPASVAAKGKNGSGTITSADISSIVSTFIGNATQVIQYTADAIDSNILKAFYDKNGANAKITEGNVESAMMPLLIACIGRINLNGYKLAECIHPEDFDACKDVEALLFICLREYLSYILPENDYNSLATLNESTNTIEATLDGTILPMARDAVTYVMQGYVPVTKLNGQAWDVYEDGGVNSNGTLKDNSTIFELLNSVVAYYAGEYQYKNGSIAKSVGAMGVGALLGICDTNGKSTIKNNSSTTIWNNIDTVANKLMPVLGVLQGKSAGQFDSYDLIWNNVVCSLVNIGDTNGVTTILTKLLTIVSAEPIQSKEVIYTIYDVVRDFLNGLIGDRYGNHHFVTSSTPIVPARSSDHPFDDILQVGVLAGTGGADNQVGMIQKLICTVVEYTGYKGNGGNGNGGTLNAYPDSMFRGIMFALKAVQSFVPSILGTIGDHSLGMATAQYEKTAIGSVAVNGTVNNVKLIFTNNSVGVNNAYVKTAANGNKSIEKLGRYYMKITDATAVGSQGATCSLGGYNSSQLIEPGKYVTLTGTSGMTGTSSSVTATITYDIIEKAVDGTMRTVKSGVKLNAYQFLSGESGWKDSIYNGSSYVDAIDNAGFSMSWGRINKSVASNNGYKVFAADPFAEASRYKRMSVIFPEYLILTTSSPYDINNYQFKVICDTGKKKSIDGFYCYDEKSGLYNDKVSTTNANVSVTTANAIPVFDKETGGIVKYGRQDALISKVSGNDRIFYNQAGNFFTGSEETSTVVGYENMSAQEQKEAAEPFWDRGTVWGHFESGKDEGTGALGIDEIMETFTEAKGYTVQTRDHIAYTIDELKTNGMLQAYHKNKAGIVEYVYIKPGNSGYAYDTVFNQISLRGPIDGVYIDQGKMENVNGSAYTTGLFKYDGTTLLEQSKTTVKLCLYNSGDPGYLKSGSNTCTLIVTDDNSAEELNTKFKEITNTLAQYQDSDFTDAGVLASTKKAVINSLAAQAAPLTPTSAEALADKTYLATSTETVASEYGDRAYVPYTGTDSEVIPSVTVDGEKVSMPKKVYAEATLYNGIWYYDKDHTMPIYSPKPLTSSDVTNGKDAAGIDVIEGKDNDAGKFYIKNKPVYEMVWNEGNNDLRPYQSYKLENGNRVQAKNDDKKLLYSKITYVYRDANGDKVNSDFIWACKFPATEYKCLTQEDSTKAYYGSTVGYRGNYTAERDSLVYWQKKLMDVVDTSIAAQVVSDISLQRHGMNNNNFEVVTYNKMTDLAKKAERGYSFTFDYNKWGKKEHAEWEGFTDFMKYVNNDDNDIIGLTKNDDGTITIDYSKITFNSTLSSIEVNEYLYLFQKYADAVIERGYNGKQIEKEIACASGNAYSAFGDVTKAVWEKDDNGKWNRTTDAEVNAGSVTAVPFGAIVDGKLVNEGPVVYAPHLWDAYIEALANALAIAKEGNSTYPYKAAGTYNLTDSKAYTCQITDSYSADTALQAAEIKLEGVRWINVDAVDGGYVTIDKNIVDPSKPYGIDDGWTVSVAAVANEGYTVAEVPFVQAGGETPTINYVESCDIEGVDTSGYRLLVKGGNATVTPVFVLDKPSGFNVTASLVVAKNGNGATDGVAVNGDYTITVYEKDTDTVVATLEDAAMSADNNTFTLEAIPTGEYDVVISSAYSIDRVCTLVVTDSDIDFATPISILACDYNQKDGITGADAAAVFRQSAVGGALYCDLNGKDGVTGADAAIVFSCAAGGTMPAVTIQ